MGAGAVPLSGPQLTARGRGTRQRIVSAAAALFHAQGVGRTTLDDVRAATATSKSQLYHYFADKADLVRAVVDHQVEQVLKAQQPELDAIDSIDSLRRWRDRVVAVNRQSGCASGCPLGRLAGEVADSEAATREALLAGFAAWQDRLAAGLATMRAGGHLPPDSQPETLALGLLAATQGGLLLAQAAGRVQPLEVAVDQAIDRIEALARSSTGHLPRGGRPPTLAAPSHGGPSDARR